MENITPKETIKSWFQKGLKPLAAQFAAWMDAYWHKGETIPVAAVEGLEHKLNAKADNNDLANMLVDMRAHEQNTTLHKTSDEQSRLDRLAADPNATYATKEELALLNGNSAIIIPIDFTIPEVERRAEVQAACSALPEDLTGRAFYFLFKYFSQPSVASPAKMQLVYCQQPEFFRTGIDIIGVLATPVTLRDDIDMGVTDKFPRRESLYIDLETKESDLDESSYDVAVSMKSFNLYFFPEGKFPSDWETWRAANAGTEISGVLTRYANENSVACDDWDDLYSFVQPKTMYHESENRLPPVMLRTISSGSVNTFKPSVIESKDKKTGVTNRFLGFTLRTWSIETVDGRRCYVEDTLSIPLFTGYGSAYTYKVTITPCNPDVLVVAEYPADLSGLQDGTIIIKNPEAV